MTRLPYICLAVALAAALAACAASAPPQEQPPADVRQEGQESGEEQASFLLPQGFEPLGDVLLDYDEIRPVTALGTIPAMMVKGYFAVDRGGLWGLMRADGTELLPCTAQDPPCFCGAHWHWTGADADEEEWQRLDAALQEGGDGELGGGHGLADCRFYYDVEACAPLRLDTLAYPCEVTSQDTGRYGALLPVYPCHAIGEPGDPPGLGDPEGDYFYFDTVAGEGVFFHTDAAVTNANWFFDQPLAPVQLDGGAWVYIGRDGTLASDMTYAPTYGEEDIDGHAGAPTLAAYLQNGYAAVCRAGTENAWGLLDGAGAEAIPAEYAGCVWDGDTLWLRPTLAEPWQGFTLAK